MSKPNACHQFFPHLVEKFLRSRTNFADGLVSKQKKGMINSLIKLQCPGVDGASWCELAVEEFKLS